MYKLTDKAIARLWSKVVKAGPDECWLWTSTVNSYGYGVMGLDYKTIQATRLMYQAATGEFPGKFCVCHTCDNRLCVNPAHLFLGTIHENNSDRARKGRNAKQYGENGTHNKLTNADVTEIFNLRAKGLYQREIAARFGVSQTLVGRILRGKNWPHFQKKESQ